MRPPDLVFLLGRIGARYARGFKCEVSSVKTGKEWSGLPTSHPRLRTRPKANCGRYPTIPVFYHSTIPRQTNPIWGRAKHRTSAVQKRSCGEWDTGEAVEKQSQFQKEFHVRSVKCEAGEPSVRVFKPSCFKLHTSNFTLRRSRRAVVQTNPISTSRARRPCYGTCGGLWA